MRYESTFYFSGADTMAGDFDNVINTAHQPEITFLIDSGSVAGSVCSRESFKICFLKPFFVSIDSAHKSWPGFSDDKISTLICIRRSAVFTHNRHINTGHREAGGTWF